MTVLDHQLPSRVTAEMPNVQLGRLFITLIASFFYVLGFVAAKTVRTTVFVAVWIYTATRLGWQEGMAKPTPRTS